MAAATSRAGDSPETVFTSYADWYDRFNPQKDYAAEVRYVIRQIEELGMVPRRWLDIGCGTGHHLFHLDAAGIDVEGVDRSPAMIARARSAYPQIRFQVGSAEELNVEGNRDVISMLFHVMSYHVSDAAIDAALQRIGPRLSSSGVFVFDFWHSGGVTRDPPGFRVRETRVDGRPLFRVTTPTEDRAQHLIAVQYDFRWDSTDGPLVHTETHTMRHFTARELTVFLAAAGMEPIRCEGWMSGSGLSELDWYGCMYARRRP